MKKQNLKKLFLFPLLFSFLSILSIEALSQGSSEDIENWFNDDYWYERVKIFDKSLCDALNQTDSNTSKDDCDKKKSKAEIKYEADFLRKLQCETYIKVDFKTNTRIKVTNQIINDCKRIFNSYKDDYEFDSEYFSPQYISFALNKKLPYFDGEYKRGKKHGKGELYLANGSRYIGEFRNDLFNGKGMFFLSNGNRYYGEFKDGVINGKGTLNYSSGSKYEGNFINNKIEGKGTYISSSGQKYFGFWSNNEMKGEGVLYNKNGEIVKQGIWENFKLIKSKKVDLAKLKNSNELANSDQNEFHEICLKANDYKGCMDYKMGETSTTINKNSDDIDCINYVCSPEDAKVYKTDNLGLKLIPGYYFIDIPERRAVNFYSNPLKVEVNGEYGRYVHIQRIIRYYSEGYSGSLTTSPGIGENSIPRINYNPGKAPGIRQIVQNHIFDCEEKTTARYKGNRLIKSETKSGRKKKWLDFEEALGYSANKGIKACQKSKNFINSLNISPFDKFHKKEIKSSSKRKSLNINCNSSVWKNKPQCQ